MISQIDLSNILEKYNLNINKMYIDKLLEKGNVNEIIYVLEYLVSELDIHPSYIEKCPSILYFNVKEILFNRLALQYVL